MNKILSENISQVFQFFDQLQLNSNFGYHGKQSFQSDLIVFDNTSRKHLSLQIECSLHALKIMNDPSLR